MTPQSLAPPLVRDSSGRFGATGLRAGGGAAHRLKAAASTGPPIVILCEAAGKRVDGMLAGPYNEHMLAKYPRTPHLQGSRSQPGDEDLEVLPFAALRGRHLVVEEKLDGATPASASTPMAGCCCRAGDTT